MDILKLEPTRVWRTYLGGRNLDEREGRNGDITSFPEDWIASVTKAVNAGRENIVDEGLSKICATNETLSSVMAKEHCRPMGFLMKLIDSSERLTIQVHPTRETALRLFSSPYGKTESWYFLGDGESCIYLGFKKGMTKERWKAIFHAQDIDDMLSSLNRIKVKKGDVVIIRGGVPHAIGEGCFLCELQEPTDLSIRTERTTPSGFHIADSQCHQGIGFDKMFDVFEYDGMDEYEVRSRFFLEPKEVFRTESLSVESLITYSVTPFFEMRRLAVDGTALMDKVEKCCVIYILEGEGRLNGVSFKAHDRFFVPSSIRKLTLTGLFSAIECQGPMSEGEAGL